MDQCLTKMPGAQISMMDHNGPTPRRPNFLSLDKSVAIPSECSCLTIYAGYFDHGRILVAKQPDIAGVHCKDSTIPSFISDIYFVQTSCGAAMD